MKLCQEYQVTVKGKVFGGEKLLECIPVISKNREALICDMTQVASHNPDIIEWRIDWLERLDDNKYVTAAMKDIVPIVGNIPILLTFRHISEGGAKEEPQQVRLDVIRTACEMGIADIVDVEMANPSDFIEEVKSIVRQNNVKLVISTHDFSATPPEEEILDRIKTSKEMGADIAKVCYLPGDFQDVLRVARATYRARAGECLIPLITVSMGALGGITRVMGREIGSDLSFLSAAGASGPGQMNIEDYRQMKKIIDNTLSCGFIGE